MIGFGEFEKISEERWQEELARMLKLQSLDDWKNNTIGGVSLNPFIFPNQNSAPTGLEKAISSWKSGISIGLKAKNKNEIIHSLLLRGVECIQIPFHHKITNDLKGVHLDYIYLDLLKEKDCKLSEISNLLAHCSSFPTQKMSGCINFDYKKDRRLIQEVHSKIPVFHLLESQSNQMLYTVDELCDHLFQLEKYLEFCNEQIIDVSVIKSTVHIGNHLIMNVSKMRALRILWANLLASKNIDFCPLFISCNVHSKLQRPQTHDDKIHLDNKGDYLIQNSMRTINAVLSTADIVINGHIESESEFARLSNNIQQIFKLENKLNLVDDPLAGSYQIEELTKEIATKAWDTFNK